MGTGLGVYDECPPAPEMLAISIDYREHVGSQRAPRHQLLAGPKD